MISTAIELKPALDSLRKTTENGIYRAIYPTDTQWFQLSYLKDILQALYNPTIILQGEQYTTSNIVLIYISTIYTKLEDQL